MTLILVTTKYGKEYIAMYELGDALFPYDPNLLVTPVECHKGILLVKTKLAFNSVIDLLKLHPPSTIERLIELTYCSDSLNELLDEIRKSLNLNEIKNKVLCLEFKTPEFLKKRIKEALSEMLKNVKSINCKNFSLKMFFVSLCHDICFSMYSKFGEFLFRKHLKEQVERICKDS